MMKECYPGADTEKLERHIFRMYDTNEVRNAELNNCLEEKNIFNAIECCYHLAEAK